MSELAAEVARLADIAERLLERVERQERERAAERLEERWPAPPSRMGTSAYLQAIPGLAQHFERTVPDEFVCQVDVGEYEVACPCGREPHVHLGRLESCGCGRWFLHDGAKIHVARFEEMEETAAGEEAAAA